MQIEIERKGKTLVEITIDGVLVRLPSRQDAENLLRILNVPMDVMLRLDALYKTPPGKALR